MKDHTLCIERALEAALPPAGEHPAALHEAMAYAVLGGGKRVRPLLVMAAGEAVDAPRAALERAACAVEMIHAYSLVHDDLPCMDDDDLRRGKPTVHRVFGEAVAVLAGDSLQSLAFDVLADEATHEDPFARIELVAELAKAAGPAGMAGGQMMDIAAETTAFDLTATTSIGRNRLPPPIAAWRIAE
jgi:farnesyl diphosphate synthase